MVDALADYVAEDCKSSAAGIAVADAVADVVADYVAEDRKSSTAKVLPRRRYHAIPLAVKLAQTQVIEPHKYSPTRKAPGAMT